MRWGANALPQGPGHEITRLLERVRDGDVAASDELYRRVYDLLRASAERHMRGQPSDHTLEPQALVHEAFLRLVGRAAKYENRAHFLATAACAMRTALVDHARGKRSAKRGAGQRGVPLDAVTVSCEDRAFNLLELNDALQKLGVFDQQAMRVVELRFFAGLSVAETATILGVSVRRVERDWTGARAWLRAEMS